MRVITTDAFMIKHEYRVEVPENYTGLLYVWDDEYMAYLDDGRWVFEVDVGGRRFRKDITLANIKEEHPDIYPHIIAFLLSGERKTNE